MDNSWDPDFLRSLDGLPLEEAQRQAIDLLESGTTRAVKKGALARDIERSKSASEVSRIMYYAYLAGSGLGLPGSGWQKKFGGNGNAAHKRS